MLFFNNLIISNITDCDIVAIFTVAIHYITLNRAYIMFTRKESVKIENTKHKLYTATYYLLSIVLSLLFSFKHRTSDIVQ